MPAATVQQRATSTQAGAKETLINARPSRVAWVRVVAADCGFG